MSQEAADRVRDQYASDPNRIRAKALVMEPRRRSTALRRATSLTNLPRIVSFSEPNYVYKINYSLA
jgi:hypothetical protein